MPSVDLVKFFGALALSWVPVIVFTIGFVEFLGG